MAKVLWHVMMSLDGFIAGPDDDTEWVFEYSGPSAMAEEVIRTTGALIVGRRTYEVEDRQRGGFYGGAWHGPYFVLTHQPPATVPDWMTGEFLNASIEDAVERAKAAAAGKHVTIFGADIARQCIERGLLDEVVIHMAPVLLGGGVRLFGRDGDGQVKLERTSLLQAGQLTDLRFRVADRAPEERIVRSEVSSESERTAVAQAIIDTNRYMTLGTADESGRPWATPVWYAPAPDRREFFWVSRPGARHSLNIAARAEIGIVIFDSTLPISTGQAVYMSATAEIVTDDAEIARGMEIFSRRSIDQGAREWTPEEVAPDGRVRLYRATASEHFVLDAQDNRIAVDV